MMGLRGVGGCGKSPESEAQNWEQRVDQCGCRSVVCV